MMGTGTIEAPRALVPPLGTRSDADLLRVIARGDLGALCALYERHHDAVRRFAVRATVGADVDELVHATFLAALDAAQAYGGDRGARAFLIGIAARIAYRRPSRPARGPLAASPRRRSARPPATTTAETRASTGEEGDPFERALTRLAPDARLVYLLWQAEGLSAVEVAEALQLPLVTVWTRLHDARDELYARMDAERRA